MGSHVHLVVDASVEHLLARAVRRIRDWELRWSRFRADSEIAALNRSAGGAVVVRSDTATLLQLAIDAWYATDGRFDPTVHDAVVAAGYGRPFVEGPTAVGSPIAAPGPAEVMVDAATGLVGMPPGVRLDLGGIAKGHAADLLVAELLDDGATGAAATIGGDTAVGGRCPFAPAWPISTAHSGSEPIAHLDRGGFCFSTTLRRRWSTPAGIAHHVIDPVTGEAAGGAVVTAAVAASTAAAAEVFATAAIVAGWPAAASLVEPAGLSGFIVTDDETRHELGPLGRNPPETACPADGRRRE